MKNIYDLELHEETEIGYGTYVRRVAGGWIYSTNRRQSEGRSVESVFVPYNDEFKPKD